MGKQVAEFGAVLSPLEKDILKTLWPSKRMRVRQIYDKLKTTRKLGLSSVAVLLDRLHDRSIVSRNVETGRGGVRYVYFPAQDRASFERGIVATSVDKLIKHFGSVAVTYFEERFKK